MAYTGSVPGNDFFVCESGQRYIVKRKSGVSQWTCTAGQNCYVKVSVPTRIIYPWARDNQGRIFTEDYDVTRDFEHHLIGPGDSYPRFIEYDGIQFRAEEKDDHIEMGTDSRQVKVVFLKHVI